MLVRLHLSIEVHMVVVVEAGVSGLHFRNIRVAVAAALGAVAVVVALVVVVW